jgi:hypothetical protein
MSTSTPYAYGSIGNVDNDEVREYLTVTGTKFVGYSKTKLLELKKYADEGAWSWKVLGFFAGVSICAYSIISILGHLLSLRAATAVIDIYLFLFGCCCCILELKENLVTRRFLIYLHREALFLYRPYGRALFYVFIGVLILATGGLIGFLIGCYVTVVGVYIFYASRDAVARLESLKSAITDESEVASKFKQYDTHNTGFLDAKALAALCQSLGTSLTAHELESAILLLDGNGDGKISYQEFLEWWKGKQETQFTV